MIAICRVACKPWVSATAPTLSRQEQQDVAQATRHRNLQECLDGLDFCALAQLNAMERKEVADAAQERKFQN